MRPTRASFAGAVLAGGHSRRMGRDKAMLRVRGETLWRRQWRILRAAGAEPVIIVRRSGQTPLGRGIRNAHDMFVDAGPIAGLHAALVAAEVPLIAVVAVDLPEIDAGWFRRLRRLCSHDVGVVAWHADGFEPLAAIYPRAALTTVTRRLRRGEFSLQGLLGALVRARRMRVLELSEDERWRVKNWNRPGDR